MVSWLTTLSCLVLVELASCIDFSTVTWKGALSNHFGNKSYNGLITRAQIYRDDVYVCIPRLKPGIMFTLLKGSVKQRDNRLEPYPLWQPQTEGDCNCLQSVVDIFLDPTGVLWALDTGATNVINPQPIMRCPPKIVAYDITTGKMVKEINLGGLVNPESRLQFILADYSKDGDCYVYVSDAGTGSFIVYDVNNNKASQVPIPSAAVPKERDVLYSVLVRRPSSENFVYFTYRSGDYLYSLAAQLLQKNKSAENSLNVGKKPRKLVLLGTDDWETIYLKYENMTEVYKWDSANPFSESNLQVVDRGKAGLIATQAVTDYRRGVMRLMESNIADYLKNGIKQQEAVNSLRVMELD